MRDFLVYVSARDGRYLAELLAEDRKFDVAVNNWSAGGRDWDAGGAEYAFGIDLEKLEGAQRLLSGIASQYKACCFLDDDIEISTRTMNRLFRVGETLELELWQAALVPGSVCVWKHLFQQPGSFVRETHFVEIMMPVFSRSALADCWASFGETQSGWGLDSLWPAILGRRGLAVVDCCTARHLKPIESARRRMRNGKLPWEECRELLARYGLKEAA